LGDQDQAYYTKLTVEQQYLSDSQKRLGRKQTGEGCQKAQRNTNPNVVKYKGLTGLSPLGLPKLTVGLGANSGKL